MMPSVFAPTDFSSGSIAENVVLLFMYTVKTPSLPPKTLLLLPAMHATKTPPASSTALACGLVRPDP
jgi:hypothetical protein